MLLETTQTLCFSIFRIYVITKAIYTQIPITGLEMHQSFCQPSKDLKDGWVRILKYPNFRSNHAVRHQGVKIDLKI